LPQAGAPTGEPRTLTLPDSSSPVIVGVRVPGCIAALAEIARPPAIGSQRARDHGACEARPRCRARLGDLDHTTASFRCGGQPPKGQPQNRPVEADATLRIRKTSATRAGSTVSQDSQPSQEK
jgi:hypothetical protein